MNGFNSDNRLYFAVKKVSGLILGLKYKMYYEGVENLQGSGYIIAANHVTALDALMIIRACPTPCHFMAKSELFRFRLAAGFLRKLNAFPVNRGKSDIKAISTAKTVLEQGCVLGIFPQGTRTPEIEPKSAKSAVGYLVKKTSASVVPASIYISKRGGLRRCASVRFGRPIEAAAFSFDEHYRSAQIRDCSARIMQSVYNLWQLGPIPAAPRGRLKKCTV